MTNDEARKVVAGVLAYFPGRLTPETVRAWAMELEAYDRRDGVAGARRLGRTSEHPSLAALIEAIEFERGERLRRESMAPSAIIQLARQATPDNTQEQRTRVAREVAMDMVFGRIGKDVDFACEVARRLAAERVTANRGGER